MMRALYALLALFFMSTPSGAGVFFGSDTALFASFIIVHPAGYSGAGGPLGVKICVAPNSSTLVPPVQSAIKIWNDLNPMLQNCDGCRLWEEGSGGGPNSYSMESTVLHELGHCAVGLNHINWDDMTNSFTHTKDAISIDAGIDGVRGSRDDVVLPLPGSRMIHWFRTVDNDPFVIDGTVIDSNSFTRVINDLPSGSSWSASGNRGVGDFLGLMNTQSVMYSGVVASQRYLGLIADDVSTVRLGMAGIDLVAGTSDDYTIELVYEPDCLNADIEVRFGSLAELGACLADLNLIPTGLLEIHHEMIPFSGEARIVLEINDTTTWDTVYANGFEEGNLSQWQ